MWEQWGDLGVAEGMWEVEAGVSEIEVPKVGVKGRLRQCLPFWREVINASPTVMSSPSWRSPHHEFVGALSICGCRICARYCNRTGCIVQVEATPHINSPLSVVTNERGKKRLVINLRHLNRFLWKSSNMRICVLQCCSSRRTIFCSPLI